MRLIVTLKNTEKIKPIEREYIRNFIYNCLRNTRWSFYHDKRRYIHFSFSNLFPFDSKTGEINSNFNLIISSPYGELIEIVKNKLDNEKTIVLGRRSFQVSKLALINTPKNVDKVITATPIITRAPQVRYQEYGIESDKEYVFWEESKVLNAFLDLLIKNLRSRYEDFKIESQFLGFKTKYEDYPDNLRLFSTLKYKKTVYKWDKHNIGTMWEFGIAEQYKNSDIVRYMFEAGLGERNASSGSGFLNIPKKS